MKQLYFVIITALLYLLIGNITNNKIVIPDEAMRLRIIANSNDEVDQNVKKTVKKNLEVLIRDILIGTKTLPEAYNRLESNIISIRSNIEKTLEEEKYLKPFKISLGKNYFPKKELYGITYNEGNYDSLVITLGNGLGNNWWCVLFPPLCLIEGEETDEVQYRLYVKDLINKYT